MSKAPEESGESLALALEVKNERGVLHELTGVIARLGGNITWVAIRDSRSNPSSLSFPAPLPTSNCWMRCGRCRS